VCAAVDAAMATNMRDDGADAHAATTFDVSAADAGVAIPMR
jgi:hypothetical protein